MSKHGGAVRTIHNNWLQPQPDFFAFTEQNIAFVEATIAKYPAGRQASAVLPLLMRAQEQEGWLSRAAIEWVATRLSMSKMRVLEIATFYTQFQLSPVGKLGHVRVCGTTPCMLRGSEEIIRVCRKRINAEQFVISDNGHFSWEEVECLGACANAPVVAILNDTYEDLTPVTFNVVLDALEAGKSIKAGSQTGRIASCPDGGPTTLVG